MLPDPERKLLRILINYPSPVHKSRMPDFKLLEVMTGRRRTDLLRGLQYLEDGGFIVWPDKDTTEGIEVIKNDVEHTLKPRRNNIAYWTQ